jgi:hypothetical protein
MKPELVSLAPAVVAATVALAGVVAAVLAGRRLQPARVKATRRRDRR